MSAMGLTTRLNSSAIPFAGESHIGKPRQNPSVIDAYCSQQGVPSSYQATSRRRQSDSGQMRDGELPSIRTIGQSSRTRPQWSADEALGGVDSKDSLLGANQIQGFFWGGGLGCDGSFGFERHGVGADGSADYRSARPEGFDRPRQPDVR